MFNDLISTWKLIWCGIIEIAKYSIGLYIWNYPSHVLILLTEYWKNRNQKFTNGKGNIYNLPLHKPFKHFLFTPCMLYCYRFILNTFCCNCYKTTKDCINLLKECQLICQFQLPANALEDFTSREGFH